MSMMKAAVFEKPGVITVRQVPVPSIGDDDVLIKVKYTGICGTDHSIYTGKYSADKLPLVAGHEFSGVIEKLGRNAKGLTAGDRVIADINQSCGRCYFCRHGQVLLCPELHQLGIHINGSFAEFVAVPWTYVHKLPDRIDLLDAAFIEPLTCVIHNAKTMNAELGSSVAVIGCGLGIIHGALAILRGCAPVIVIGDNERKLAVAKSMGVDFTINVKECSDVVGEVRKLTKGRGPDYVVEAVGSAKTYELAFEMVRSGGLVSAFGITGGDDILPLHPAELVLHEKKIAGSCAGSGNDWTEAITLVEHGRIVPKRMFSMLVPLEELEAAMKELRSNPDLIKVLVSAEVSKRQIL